MAKCPKCGATLLEDSGLVTCHSCGAIVIIDEDGNPITDNGERASPASPASNIAPAPVATSRQSQASAPLDPLEYLGGLAGTNETPSDAMAASSPEPFEPAQSYPDQFGEVNEDFAPSNLQANSFGLSEVESNPAHDVNSSAPNSIPDMGFPINSDFADMGGYDSSAAEEAVSESNHDESSMGEINGHPDSHVEPMPAPEASSEDFFENGISFAEPDAGGTLSEDDPLGLNAFANSEVSAANDGMLVCRVIIDGIDTKEIRANLRAAMDDQKFNWDLNEVLGRLKNGQLVIEKITPVKAMVLIKRIKQMPVHIRWEQYTIAEVEEEAETTFEQDPHAH